MKALALLFVAAAAIGASDRPVVSRDAMADMEQRIDRAIRGVDPDEPLDLLGFTRGVYLPGYGVVLTAELNLVLTPITPFHPIPSGAQLPRLRDKKRRTLIKVKEMMRQELIEAANSLESVPADEHIVLAITFFYRSFELREGLPNQIVMEAPRQALVKFKAKDISLAELNRAIQAQEL